VSDHSSVRKYLSGHLHPDDVLYGFAHGDFVLIPIYIEGDLRGVIYADNRFTGNRINEFECHVLELFSGMAGAIIQASEVPNRLKGALQQSAEMVAHKLRNRLAIISDHLDDLLVRKMQDADAANFARVALDETRNAQRIVRAFLGFAKSEPFERPDTFTPAELVERLRREVEGKARIPVEISVAPALPTIRVSIDRLIDDFLAFASDSKRHRENGLLIRISAEKPVDEEIRQLKLPSRRSYLKLTYSDNGPGIPKGFKEKIFDPFFTRAGGSGLGLTIAAYNAKVHGGCIVESGAEGHGVRFDIYLNGDDHERKEADQGPGGR